MSARAVFNSCLRKSNIRDCTSEKNLTEILQGQRVCKSHLNVGLNEASVLRGMEKKKKTKNKQKRKTKTFFRIKYSR